MGLSGESSGVNRPILVVSDDLGALGAGTEELGWRLVPVSHEADLAAHYLESQAGIAVIDGRADIDRAIEGARAIAADIDLNGGGLLMLLPRAAEAVLPRIIEAGATHFLIEPFTIWEVSATLQLIERQRRQVSRTARAERRRSLQPLSVPADSDGDPLTGLAGAPLARRWIEARLGDKGCHIILLAVTRFEIINTAFGRDVGDRMLQMIGRLIVPLVKDAGGRDALVARTTGAEFVIGLDGEIGRERVAFLADQVAAMLDRPHPVGEHMISVSSRIAAVSSEASDRGATDVLRRAGASLAELKSASGVRVQHLSAEVSEQRARERELSSELRAALDGQQIEILFQPQVSVTTGQIAGVEALARWQHPRHGMLGAATLFAVAEQSDYVGALSNHIQQRAIAAAAGWPEPLAGLRLSVNVTAEDILVPGFADRFFDMVDSLAFPRERLTVELTETGLIADLARASELLSKLRAGRCRVAIDDFGTGYSSLAYLKALPLDYLKIDQRLSADITGSSRDRIVVRGVIDMARSLGLGVIAEGVETHEQLTLLAREGCNYYQGFLFSGPVTTEELVRLSGA
jgi:diguanylate cyclase (GGDEF)-like protein